VDGERRLHVLVNTVLRLSSLFGRSESTIAVGCFEVIVAFLPVAWLAALHRRRYGHTMQRSEEENITRKNAFSLPL
jgi:hypothetical protein